MNKTGKENLVMINDEEYVHCPVCGTLTSQKALRFGSKSFYSTSSF